MASSYANVQNAWLFRDMDVEAEFSRTLRERHDDQTKAIALARFGPEGDLLSRLRGNESTTKDDALSVKAREVAAQRKPGEHDWFTRPAGQSKSLAGYSFDINCPALKKAAGAVVIGADAFTWNERDQLPSPDEIKRRNRERSAALRMQAMKQKPLEDALDWKTKGVLQFGSPDGPCEEPGTIFFK
mmetsp:Transcript_4510/g.7946  ORF Transcript_4510/g.7946 Transcript_4510/m.7946 type:complete len:186 (-) Transcript_4510:210-767(-)